MKLKEYHIAYLPFVVVSLAFIFFSLPLPDIESKFLPLLFAGVLLLVCLIGLWWDSTAERNITAPGEDRTEVAGEKTHWLHYIRDAAWLVGLVLVIYFVGFLIAMPLYILAYTRVNGTKWWAAITLAIVLTVAIYFSFERAFGVELYRGIFFGARSW